MKKTKAQIMNDIIIYAKGKEITPSLIRRYLMGELHLSKASAYRFLKKSDNEYIDFNKKKREKRDNIDYSNEEYEELTQNAFEIIHKMGKNSSHMITLEEIVSIADEVGTTARFLSCNILGLDTKTFDKLINGEIKETQLSLGLGFKDPVLSERVKRTKNELIQSMLGRRLTLEEIDKLSKEKEIPLQIMLKKVCCLTRAQILNLHKGKSVLFSNAREFIDYKYNEPVEFEDISRDLKLDQLGNSEYIVFQEEDEKDSIYEDDEFYNIAATSQEEFIEKLNDKRERLRLKKEYLIEKYDEMYLELLNSYKELNIKGSYSSIHTPNANKMMESYIKEIREIIIRNPKYYDFYPPKLKLKDFEKIAEDFNLDKKFLAYKMFRDSHYDRRKKNAENPYFEISDKKLPEASSFYILFQNEIDNGIKKIVHKTINSNTRVSPNIAEDLYQILRMRVIIRGNEILFHGKDYRSKDEYLAGMFAYLKAVCDSQCKKLKSTNKSLNDRINNDSESEFGDFVPSEDLGSYFNVVETVLESAADSSDQQIMEDMIRCIEETGNREDALKKLAEEMKISTEDLEAKLNEIYERLN